MLFDKIDEQTIALAGLYQSCHVVSKIAWNGEYYEKDFNPLINNTSDFGFVLDNYEGLRKSNLFQDNILSACTV